MGDYTKYINNLKLTKPKLSKDIDESEKLAAIAATMIEQRQHLELSELLNLLLEFNNKV